MNNKITIKKTAILPANVGCWNVTSYPFGGDFFRGQDDLNLFEIEPSAKQDWIIAKTIINNKTIKLCIREDLIINYE